MLIDSAPSRPPPSAANLSRAWHDAAAALRAAERDLRPVEKVQPLREQAEGAEAAAARAAEEAQEAEEAEETAQEQARDVGE